MRRFPVAMVEDVVVAVDGCGRTAHQINIFLPTREIKQDG